MGSPQSNMNSRLLGALSLATAVSLRIAPTAMFGKPATLVSTGKLAGTPAASLPGVTKPFDGGFDPLGFAARASPAEMIKYREAELKHGRVAMLASLGFAVQELFVGKLLSDGSTVELPGIFAFQYEAEEKTTFWPLWIVLIGALELNANAVKGWVDPAEGKFEMKTDYTPGSNFEMGPWTKANSSPLVYARRQNAELNNGRLAMIAVALLVIKEKITGLAVAGDFEGSELKAIGQLGAEIAGSQ